MPLFFTKLWNYGYDLFKKKIELSVQSRFNERWGAWHSRWIAKIIMFPHFLGDCSRNSSLTYIAFGNQAKNPVRVSHESLFIDSNFWTINESIIAPEDPSWIMNVDFLLEKGWISRLLQRFLPGYREWLALWGLISLLFDTWATKKNPPVTFHCTGCFIRILIMVHYNPTITG